MPGWQLPTPRVHIPQGGRLLSSSLHTEGWIACFRLPAACSPTCGKKLLIATVANESALKAALDNLAGVALDVQEVQACCCKLFVCKWLPDFAEGRSFDVCLHDLAFLFEAFISSRWSIC